MGWTYPWSSVGKTGSFDTLCYGGWQVGPMGKNGNWSHPTPHTQKPSPTDMKTQMWKASLWTFAKIIQYSALWAQDTRYRFSEQTKCTIINEKVDRLVYIKLRTALHQKTP